MGIEVDVGPLEGLSASASSLVLILPDVVRDGARKEASFDLLRAAIPALLGAAFFFHRQIF
jgi:hypothetical protein